MLVVKLEGNRIRFGDRFFVSFQRTLRIPEDGQTYPLPPAMGEFPVYEVESLVPRLSVGRRDLGDFLIPMYQCEALWLGFDGASWRPNAVQVFAGGVNAVTGGRRDEGLQSDPQNYVICPDQPWLDGIYVGTALVHQFVAVALGTGYSIEAQLTSKEDTGGIQLVVYEPRLGRFSATPPPDSDLRREMQVMAGMDMGLGAGGKIQQKIYPDPYGVETWDADNWGSVDVRIINSRQFREITGQAPPPSPVDASTYAEHGFPWFALYDESQAALPASEQLAGVQTVGELSGLPETTTIDAQQLPVLKLRTPGQQKS